MLRYIRAIAIVLSIVLAMPAGRVSAARSNDMIAQSVRIKASYYSEKDKARYTGWGSGANVDLSEFGHPERNYILTCAHAVLDEKGGARDDIQVEVLAADGSRQWVKATVVSVDKDLDVCILRVPVELVSLGRLAPDDSIRMGDKMTAVGGPRGERLQESEGKVVEDSPWRCRMQADANIDHGNSGGPIFDSSGRLAGVVVSGDGDKNGNIIPHTCNFVPVDCVRKFIRKAMPPPPKPEPARVVIEAVEVNPFGMRNPWE